MVTFSFHWRLVLMPPPTPRLRGRECRYVVMPKPQAEQEDGCLHFLDKCSLYATVPKIDSDSAILPLRARHQNEGSRKHTCSRFAGVIGTPPQEFSMLPASVPKALHFGSRQKMVYGGVRNRDLLLGRFFVCGLLDMDTDTQLVSRVGPISTVHSPQFQVATSVPHD